MSPSPSPRRPGGQPGNTNALKHGLYARHYPPEILGCLNKWEVDDLSAEIQLIRVSLDLLTRSLHQNDMDDELRIKQNNAIAQAVNSLVRASRQHVNVHSRNNPVLVAWFDTLASHEFFFEKDSPANG